MADAFSIIWILAIPAVAIIATRYSKLCELLGAVVLAYLFGMLLPNLPLTVNPSAINTLRDLTIPLAIPLLLFNLDIRSWFQQAGPAVLGFSLAIISVIAMGAFCFFLLGHKLDYASETVGMLTGMYIGGTPNMAVVHQALNAPDTLFIQTNALDVLFGGAWFLILISVAGRIYGLFLKPYQHGQSSSSTQTDKETTSSLANLIIAIITAIAIVGASVGISQLLLGKLAVPLIMLLITSLSIAGSLIPRLRNERLNYSAGYYSVLAFCVAIGASVDLAELFQNPGWLAAAVGLMFFGSLTLHAFLAWLFKLDRDTTIITATAAIYGPPFVPPVANALNNPALLLSGLTTGLAGYALGNYLGISVAWLLAKLA